MLKKSNPLLNEIPVNLNLYGKFTNSGKHINEPDSCPNLYNSERNVYFKDFEKLYFPDEKAFMDDSDRKL